MTLMLWMWKIDKLFFFFLWVFFFFYLLKVNTKGQHSHKYNVYCFPAGHLMIGFRSTIHQLAVIWIQALPGKTPRFLNVWQQQVSHCFGVFFPSLCSFSLQMLGAQNAVVWQFSEEAGINTYCRAQVCIQYLIVMLWAFFFFFLHSHNRDFAYVSQQGKAQCVMCRCLFWPSFYVCK